MPFLNDQEHEELQDKITALSAKNEALKSTLSELEEELGDVKSTARNRNILLSCLSGILIALSLYFYQNQSISEQDIEAIKNTESNKILDSVSESTDIADEDYDDSSDIQTNINGIEKIKDNVMNKVVYSVQIAAFTNKKYPLLSKTIAGTMSNEEYLRYSIGLFATLKEAQKFRYQLIKLGFKDAFVASYLNGKRQKIHNPY